MQLILREAIVASNRFLVASMIVGTFISLGPLFALGNEPSADVSESEVKAGQPERQRRGFSDLRTRFAF